MVARIARSATASVATPLLLDALALGASPDAQLTRTGTIPMPVLPSADPAQMRLTVGGVNTLWGSLSRSGDGRMLVVAGVDAAPGSPVVNVSRVVGTVSFDGVVDVSTAVGGDGSTIYNTGIWSATTVDGSGFWTVGSSTNNLWRGNFYTPAGTYNNATLIW